MKFFAILAFVGFAAAYHGESLSSSSGLHGASPSSYEAGVGSISPLMYGPGHELVYKYQGRLLTGIPELNHHHFSGLSIKCDVVLQVESFGKMVMKIRNPEFAHANGHLEPETGSQEGNNWRHLKMPQEYRPMPELSKRMLEKPVVVEVESMRIRSLIASSEEPEWSVNFKKALVALFQTGSITPETVKGSIVRGIPEIWSTYEQSPDGECETKYTMHEIPETLARGSEESGKMIPHSESCPSGSKLYEITKVRNLDNCIKSSVYWFSRPGRWSCTPSKKSVNVEGMSTGYGSCGSVFTRSSVTRYTVCGTPDRFVVQSIVNEGEIYGESTELKTEKSLTGIRQVLKLTQKSSIESRFSENEISSPVRHESLMVRYSKSHHEEQINKLSSGILPQSGDRISKEELIRKAEDLVKEVIESGLFNVHGLPNEHLSYKVLVLSKVFKMFDRTMLMKVYENVVRSQSGEKHEVAKNVLVDTIVMSGTPESIKFFVQLVERNELPKSQVAAIFFNLPRTVIAPTEYLLEQIFHLIKSEQVKSESYVYKTAILSFSNLIQRSCLTESTTFGYPKEVFGRICHKESSIITEKWIPYLERELRQSQTPEMKYVHIVALGLMSHEQILPVLLPIIEEKGFSAEFSQRDIHMARYIAIYGLIKTGLQHRERVMPIVSALYSNKGEPTDIRISAFYSIMALKPDMAQLQKISALTWTEEDTEVLRTVNSAFFSIAYQTSMQDYEPEMSTLIRRVRLIYPLLKKTGGHILPSSGSIYTNDFLNRMKVGYQSIFGWIGSDNSVIPKNVYSRLSLFESEEYMFTPLEICVHLREIFPTLYDSLSGVNSTPFEEMKNKVSHEWRQTIEKLRLKIRENGTPEAFLYATFFEDSTIFMNLAKSSSEELKNVLKNPALLRQYLSGEKTFNYQRVFDLTPSEGVTSSDMGLPIYFITSMPTIVSFRGLVRSETDIASGKLDMTFHSIVDKRLIGSMGTICPITGEFFVAGIDQHVSMTLPVDWTLKFNLNEGEIKSDVKISNKYTTSPADIVYYAVTPFTAKQKVFDTRPVYKTGGFKVIRTQQPLKKQEYSFGEYFGMDLKLQYESETPYFGLRYYLQKLYNLKYNPINYMRFPNSQLFGLTPSGLPSGRRHQLRIVYDPQSSQTKEIKFSLKFGFATKEKEQPIKYHKLAINPESGKIVKVISEPIGQISGQVKRQELLKNILERIHAEKEGRAMTVLLSTTLVGSRPRSYTYSATFGTGMSGIKQKWDLKLESEQHSEKVCVAGEVSLPVYGKLNIEEIRSESPVFRYHNVFAYGINCESKVIVDGYAKTSEQMKKYSRESPEAKEYYRLLQKGTPMIKMSKLAEKVRIQASALDEVHYKVKFVNVGRKVNYVTREGLQLLQLNWLPYYRFSTSSPVSVEELISVSGSIESGKSYLASEIESSYESSTPPNSELIREPSYIREMNIRTRVHPLRKTFDIDLIVSGSSEVQYLYREIPLPYPMTHMYPMSYVHGPVSSTVKFLTGKPVYPICTLEAKHISTFDNRTYEAKMDDCFHLLSADCSKSVQYSVLARSLESQPEKKELKVIVGKTEITMKPEGGRHIKVRVDGQEIRVPEQEYENIVRSGQIVAKVIKYKDNTVMLRSPKINVIFDGENVQLEGSNLLKNKLCGLCGDNNNKKSNDLLSPRMCVLSKPELVVASYRVGSLPSKQCRPLPESIKSQLRFEEEEKCVRPGSKRTPTRVSESYLHSVYGPNYASVSYELPMKHHEIVDKFASDEYCFSRIPILECGFNTYPSGVREKTVSFTCMRKDRTSEYIAQKIRNGEVVPDLKNYPISYETERTIPIECKTYSSY